MNYYTLILNHDKNVTLSPVALKLNLTKLSAKVKTLMGEHGSTNGVIGRVCEGKKLYFPSEVSTLSEDKTREFFESISYDFDVDYPDVSFCYRNGLGWSEHIGDRSFFIPEAFVSGPREEFDVLVTPSKESVQFVTYGPGWCHSDLIPLSSIEQDLQLPRKLTTDNLYLDPDSGNASSAYGSFYAAADCPKIALKPLAWKQSRYESEDFAPCYIAECWTSFGRISIEWKDTEPTTYFVEPLPWSSVAYRKPFTTLEEAKSWVGKTLQQRVLNLSQ